MIVTPYLHRRNYWIIFVVRTSNLISRAYDSARKKKREMRWASIHTIYSVHYLNNVQWKWKKKCCDWLHPANEEKLSLILSIILFHYSSLLAYIHTISFKNLITATKPRTGNLIKLMKERFCYDNRINGQIFLVVRWPPRLIQLWCTTITFSQYLRIIFKSRR